jgi:signal transduction histidine kinase
MAEPQRPEAPYCPPIVDPPDITPAVAHAFDWFIAAAAGTWIACGLWPAGSMVNGRFTGTPAVAFAVAFAMYGVGLLFNLSLPRLKRQVPVRLPVVAVAVQSVAGIGINADTMFHLNGTGMGLGLLVVVAAQLPYFMSPRQTWAWIALQTVALTGVISAPGVISGLELTTFALATIGFQVFAAASSILLISEGRARTNLARVNAELTATRELLAESSRTSERLRISRDLHDTLGHHLTALSLQLDVAARLSDGRVAAHVQQAHAITRLLLSDVRAVVSTLRDNSRPNLAAAIRALVSQPTSTQVHLDVPDTLAMDDPARAEALLRAVQEVLTNAARHAHAPQLWIELHATADTVILHARDDGRGADAVIWGNGLRGMRERFAAHGGTIDVRTAPGAGFEVHASMPAPPTT